MGGTNLSDAKVAWAGGSPNVNDALKVKYGGTGHLNDDALAFFGRGDNITYAQYLYFLLGPLGGTTPALSWSGVAGADGGNRIGYRRGAYGSLSGFGAAQVRVLDFNPDNDRVRLVLDGALAQDAFTTLTFNGVILQLADATYAQFPNRTRWRWTAPIPIAEGDPITAVLDP